MLRSHKIPSRDKTAVNLRLLLPFLYLNYNINHCALKLNLPSMILNITECSFPRAFIINWIKGSVLLERVQDDSAVAWGATYLENGVWRLLASPILIVNLLFTMFVLLNKKLPVNMLELWLCQKQAYSNIRIDKIVPKFDSLVQFLNRRVSNWPYIQS